MSERGAAKEKNRTRERKGKMERGKKMCCETDFLSR